MILRQGDARTPPSVLPPGGRTGGDNQHQDNMGNGMNKVLEGVYVGSIRDSKDQTQIKENKITHILSIHDNAAMTKSDIEYLCIAARDCATQDLTPYFSQSNDFIHQARLAGGNVLIHCLAGVSRSVTLTVVYIMTVTELGWRDSLNAVRGARRAANPNFGFQRQLVSFEHEGLQAERTRLLSKFDLVSFDDVSRCRDLLEKHREWVLHGDAAGKDTEEDTYPLPHGAYGERRKTGAKGGGVQGGGAQGGGAQGGGAQGGKAESSRAGVKDEKTITLEDYLNIKAEKEAKQFYKEQEEMAHIHALRHKREALRDEEIANRGDRETDSRSKTLLQNTGSLQKDESESLATPLHSSPTPLSSSNTPLSSSATPLSSSATPLSSQEKPMSGAAAIPAITTRVTCRDSNPAILISVPTTPSPADPEDGQEAEVDRFFQ